MKTITKPNYFIFWILASIVVVATACKKDLDHDSLPNPHTPSGTNVTSMQDLKPPANFDYSTTQEAQVSIVAKDNIDNPIPYVRVNIMDKPRTEGGKVLCSGATNAQGEFKCLTALPSYFKEVVVNTDFIGLPNDVVVPIVGSQITLQLGGRNPQKARMTYDVNHPTKIGGFPRNKTNTVPNIVFMGTYNNQGVPNYLEPTRDIIDAALLQTINASLPERRPVPQYHPDYLAQGSQTNVQIDQLADVWVTFVHEGAGYKNVLGYYKYPKNDPPQSTSDIDEIKIVFPNVSFAGSGGGLVSGDKVKIGQFGADTVIGFVLLANGYQNSTVTNGNWQVYSNPDINPEADPNLRQHNVLLWDAGRELMLLGFEDIRRDNSSCDNDFNDAIFYVTSNPVTAINTNNVNPIDITADADNDNISDLYDDYPNDPTRAFDNFYPNDVDFSTLVFEDLWPGTGDYDMNDMVVGYRINKVCNSSNEAVEIKTKAYVQAIGASYFNGFGIEFPFSPSAVSSVTGYSINSSSYISLGGNGLEAGQSKAVMILFDEANNILPRPGGYFSNTEQGAPQVVSDTLDLLMTFSPPINISQSGTAPYNPFLISNKRRGYEVHLPDNPPTDLADEALFKTYRDFSEPGSGRYYKTENHLPWALNMPATFAHPLERKDITQAYLKFAAWTESGGALFEDWYIDEPGYRNTNNIY